jgi:5-deoxy-glucuronate isomerase
MTNEWFYPRGALARDSWDAVVDDQVDGWRHTGLRVGTLEGTVAFPAAAAERLVVPLSGAFEVAHDGGTAELEGRASVFDGPTDSFYAGAGTAISVTGTGRVAVAEAPAARRFASRHLAREDVPVELRGAGRDTRQVHNLGVPGALDAAALIVCEVITPAGNWSSHPAHKHDEDIPGRETRLEEIYYFEAAPERGLPAPADADAYGLFASYSSAAGRIDTGALVRTGDIALVPHGYHGPASAAPEYDLYYLNVMAGPGERAWLITDDPAQSWVRQTWPSLDPDPRLPYRTIPGEAR